MYINHIPERLLDSRFSNKYFSNYEKKCRTRETEKEIIYDVYFQYTYKWTPVALYSKKRYHKTKHGISYKNYPKITMKNILMSKGKEEIPYSEYHKKLIDELYSGENKSMRILKRIAESDRHEIDLENMSAKLKAYKSSLKLKNPKNMLYYIETFYTDNRQNVVTLSKEYVPTIIDSMILAKRNKELSEYPNYHHMSLKDKKGNVLVLFVNSKY